MVVSFDDSIRAAADETIDETNNEKSGVCVKVRVRIEQEATITRTAFNAQLQLQNDGDTPLTNISVVIYIYEHNDANKTSKTHLFVIGDPDPTFLGGVNGSGRVLPKSSGTSEWLFMALSEAAPTKNVDYDVGGTLTYTIDGVPLTVDLFPDTITVAPSPKYGGEQSERRCCCCCVRAFEPTLLCCFVSISSLLSQTIRAGCVVIFEVNFNTRAFAHRDTFECTQMQEHTHTDHTPFLALAISLSCTHSLFLLHVALTLFSLPPLSFQAGCELLLGDARLRRRPLHARRR